MFCPIKEYNCPVILSLERSKGIGKNYHLISNLCQKLGDKAVENFLIEPKNVDEAIVFLEVVNIIDKI